MYCGIISNFFDLRYLTNLHFMGTEFRKTCFTKCLLYMCVHECMRVLFVPLKTVWIYAQNWATVYWSSLLGPCILWHRRDILKGLLNDKIAFKKWIYINGIYGTNKNFDANILSRFFYLKYNYYVWRILILTTNVVQDIFVILNSFVTFS